MSRVVEVNEITDSISCAVCMETFTDACVAPCGHSFCKSCAEECINLKHECPLCKAPVNASALVRNIGLQSLVDNIMQASTEYDRRYFSSLQAKAIGSADETDPSVRQFFSPIELCFASALQANFVLYQDYFRQLKHKLDTDVRNAQSLDAEAKTAAIETAQRHFDTSLRLLQQDCERFLSQTVVPPFLLATTITVTCLPRSVHFNMQVQSVTTPELVLNAIRAHFEAKGPSQQLDSFVEPIRLCLRRHEDHYGDSKIYFDISDDAKPLSAYLTEGRIDSAWKIVLESDVVLKSDAPTPCFAQVFGTPTQPPKVDYFSCVECNLNWVCSSCAECCHKGHTLRTHILGHSPNWACCYCFKKPSKSHCKFAHKNGGSAEESKSNV